MYETPTNSTVGFPDCIPHLYPERASENDGLTMPTFSYPKDILQSIPLYPYNHKASYLKGLYDSNMMYKDILQSIPLSHFIPVTVNQATSKGYMTAT